MLCLFSAQCSVLSAVPGTQVPQIHLLINKAQILLACLGFDNLCGSSMNYMWQLEPYLADLLRHYGLVEMAMLFYHRYLQDLSAVHALDNSGRRELIGAVEQQWLLLNWHANPTGRMQSFFGDVDREMERRRVKWKGEEWKWK